MTSSITNKAAQPQSGSRERQASGVPALALRDTVRTPWTNFCRAREAQAFTLIELLTVIVIIAILVALLFPAIKTVILKAETNQAKADTKNIEAAIASYRNEYGKLPTQTSDQGGVDKLYDISSAFNIYNALRAVAAGWNASDVLNPRRIAFLETPTRKGAFATNGNFLDPWGGTYLLVFDCNYDGTISGVNVTYNGKAGPALIISYGPDRIATNADDIVNYN